MEHPWGVNRGSPWGANQGVVPRIFPIGGPPGGFPLVGYARGRPPGGSFKEAFQGGPPGGVPLGDPHRWSPTGSPTRGVP
jgi:hypothetical protein